MNLSGLTDIVEDLELDGEKLLVKKDLAKAVQFVKEYYGFNLLKEIVAVDNGMGGTELIYHLYSVENEENLLLSIIVDNEAESVSKIFDSAVADEKEIYDLFGVKFIGNDELKRLYMPEGWKGHPLRKDYEENDERLRWNDEA